MDGPVFRTHDQERQIAQKEHQSEGAQELGHHGAAQQVLGQAVITKHSQKKAHDGRHGQAEQGIDPGDLGGQQPGIHADHQKFAVGEIDHVHHPEDDGQAQGHDGQDHAQQKTGDQSAE